MRRATGRAGGQPRRPRVSGFRRSGWRARLAAIPILATRLLAALLALGLLPLAGAGTAQATAAEPPAAVQITITSLTPALVTSRAADSRTEVVITGTVTNTGTTPVERPQAFLWRSLDPITDAEGLAHAQASAATDPFGKRVQVDSAIANLYTDTSPELAPKASTPFRVSATVADLTLPATDGVFLVGVQVREAFTRTVGRARLYLPVATGAPRNEVNMATLVLLASAPSLLRPAAPATRTSPAQPALLTDDHLAAEVASGGRLDKLLDDADRPQVSFAVDPDLVATLQAMREGYQVQGDSDATRDGTGRADTTRDGTGRADAGRWLARFDAMKTRRDGYRVPYAGLDLAAVARADQAPVLSAASAAAAQVADTANLPLLALPTDGLADRATLEAAASLSPRAYLVSDDTTGGAGPLLEGPAGHPILTFSGSSTTGGPGPDPRTTPTHQRQAFLAASWIDQAGTVAGSSLGSVRLETEPQDFGPAPGAPWLTQTTVSQVLGGVPRATPSALSYPSTARQAELGQPQLDNLETIHALAGRYADLVVDPGAGRRAAALTARAASGAWRTDAGAAGTWSQAVIASLRNDLDDKVVITGGHRATLTGRNDQRFPLTITNHLDRPVSVQLRFDGAFGQRLSVNPSEQLTLQPGESYQVTNEAVPRTNGTFPVTARLYTRDGSAVGQRFPVELTAADVGQVGWLIVLASGVILVAATAFRIRQVARERRPGHVSTGRT